MAEFRHTVSDLRGVQPAYGLIGSVNAARQRGGVSVNITAERIFPGGAVPFAAALDYYRHSGDRVRVSSVSDAARRMAIDAPRVPTLKSIGEPCFGITWKYRDETEGTRLCKMFVDALSEHAECAEGVLDSVNWCLYEVMDNVFQHSGADAGFAMMQVHPRQKWASISVADTGIGIHKSFAQAGVYRVENAYAAIMKAVQEKVTSKPKNMGNGLFGLIRIVGIGNGRLAIRSGRGWMSYERMKMTGDHSNSLPLLDAEHHHGTSVDWQFDLSRGVTIQEALGTTHHVDLRLEELEDDLGRHRVMVNEFEEGLGTRRSAEHVRNRLLNILNQGAPTLLLDFTGVNVVSSSFADEVLGKLALRMGLIRFMSTFKLVGMNPTVEAIVERAIHQRIAEGDETTPAGSRRVPSNDSGE